MEWLIVLMFILIGAALVVLEILVLPGVNVAGILGLVCIIAGIYLGYSFYSSGVGHMILLATAVSGGVLTWYILRSGTWKRLSLESKIEGCVEGIDRSVHEGDFGETLGRLAPMGNVKVGDAVVEAESQSGYIDAHQPVEIVKVFRNKVIVKLKVV